MMFDKKAFKLAIMEKDLTIDDIAKALEVSKTTIYRKINGESDFFRAEIQTIASIIGKEAADKIFFAK